MAWNFLNTSLTVSAKTMACKGGTIIASVKVTGQTNDDKVVNHYSVKLLDDHIIPDVLWTSGPHEAGPGTSLNEVFEVELSCNKRCKVIGPQGSSHEKTAEIYSHVIGEESEGQSDDIAVSCT